MFTKEEIELRVERAKALFKQGFNCSQAVCAACADIYGIDEQTALRIAASFGGGIGRMRQTCGAACGMFILAGLENGSATPGDAEGKKQNYTLSPRQAALTQTTVAVYPVFSETDRPKPRRDTLPKRSSSAEYTHLWQS